MKKCFLLLPFLFFFLNFVVTPQKQLSGIKRTELKNIEKKTEEGKSISILYFTNNIKDVKRDQIYPKEILNYITLAVKENTIVITYKTPSPFEPKAITFDEAIIDSYGRAIGNFSIKL